MHNLGFDRRGPFLVWLFLAVIVVPGGLLFRLSNLAAPVLEPHPIRQCQTALTAVYMAKGQASLLDYRSPLDGKLWSFVVEFPFYQWVVSGVIRAGVPFEIAARLVTFFFFLIAGAAGVWLTLRFASRQAAAWFALLYLASPFTIVYSQTALIDVTAVALMLMSLVALVKALEDSRWLVAFFVTGTLAAAIKPTVWYAATAFTFVLLALRARENRRAQAILAVQLVQLALAVLWIQHAKTLFNNPGVLLGNATWEWIIGDFSLRFSPEAWGRLAKQIGSDLFAKWMIVPFVVGLIAVRWHWLLAAGIFFSLIGPFRVRLSHEYYLFAEAPFLLFLAAVGMTRLNHKAVGLTALLFVYSLTKLPILWETMHYDRSAMLEYPRAIKAATKPDDIVLIDGGMEDWWLPLYSDRLTITSERFKSTPVPVTATLRRAPQKEPASF